MLMTPSSVDCLVAPDASQMETLIKNAQVQFLVHFVPPIVLLISVP